MGGGTSGVVNVRTAPMLVTDPAEFVATAVYVAASELLNAVSVRVEALAPLISTPFFFH